MDSTIWDRGITRSLSESSTRSVRWRIFMRWISFFHDWADDLKNSANKKRTQGIPEAVWDEWAGDFAPISTEPESPDCPLRHHDEMLIYAMFSVQYSHGRLLLFFLLGQGEKATINLTVFYHIWMLSKRTIVSLTVVILMKMHKIAISAQPAVAPRLSEKKVLLLENAFVR